MSDVQDPARIQADDSLPSRSARLTRSYQLLAFTSADLRLLPPTALFEKKFGPRQPSGLRGPSTERPKQPFIQRDLSPIWNLCLLTCVGGCDCRLLNALAALGGELVPV